MKKILTILTIGWLLVVNVSCSYSSPVDSVVTIVDSTERTLDKSSSAKELSHIYEELLEKVTVCLDRKCHGFRFIPGNEDYKNVSLRFDLFNLEYIKVASKFNPDINWDLGEKYKLQATMKAIEDFVLTNPGGYTPSELEYNLSVNPSAQETDLPTREEINATNDRLPMLVGEGTMWTRVEYDEHTMIQTFFYDFMDRIDDSVITKDALASKKSSMVDSLKTNPRSRARLNAGVTYLYVYRSVDKRKLYEIRIDKDDIS